MQKIMIIALTTAGISACTAAEQRTANTALVGAGAGAVVGGVTTGTPEGAVVGAAIGGTAGALIGAASNPGYCVYRRRDGSHYEAPCP